LQKRRLLKFGMFGLLIVIASFATLAYAAITEKREMLMTTSFKLDGGEKRFVAIYVPAPMDTLDVTVNVSKGNVKLQPYPDGRKFEESLGYVEKQINETSVEMVQYWMLELENETTSCTSSPNFENSVWYLYFLNEDTYEKEVNLEVTRVWSTPNYQDWV
jgi:hypothetical protein